MNFSELLLDLNTKKRLFHYRMGIEPQLVTVSINRYAAHELSRDTQYLKNVIVDDQGHVKINDAVLTINKQQKENCLIFLE